MASAWRKKNQLARSEGALARLKDAKFFEKNDRTIEQWKARIEQEIEILEKRIIAQQ
jgi:hypothetical protein